MRRDRMDHLLATAVLVSIFCISSAHADIKVGSYSWSQRYSTGAVTGIPAANQYGGGYCHLDISWTWTLEQGYGMANSDWTSAADCLDDNPTWYAGHVAAASVNYSIRQKNPALWSRIKAHSDAGRYDAGAMDWSEGYWSFGGDEYYLRNYYVSTRFCKDNFGYFPIISACYDLDAPAWTQPKMQSYIVGRSAQNPSGLSFYNHRTGAGGTWDPPSRAAGTASTWPSYKWTSDDGSTVIVGHEGNWGGDAGGCETCVNSAGTSRTFAEKVFQENVWNTALTNTWNSNLVAGGSGFSLFWWGARMSENRLLEAEKFATFARPYGQTYRLHGDDYLYGVWANMYQFNQHDVADAQGTPWQSLASNPTNINMQDAYTHALNVADSTLTQALATISSQVNTTGEGKSVIVYNALSWTRTDHVRIPTSQVGLTAPMYVKDPAGAVVPSQIMTVGQTPVLVFSAENVPSLGLREFKVFSGTATPSSAGVTATDGATISLENEYCKVQILKSSGAITSIMDKVNSKELLSGPGNRIASTTNGPNWWEDCCVFYSHLPNQMPAQLTYITPTSVQLTDAGPATARVTLSYTVNSVTWSHTIALNDKSPVVHNEMCTANLASNNELVVNFPLAAAVSNGSHRWNAGVAYGHQEYLQKMLVYTDYDQARWTFTQKWAHVANDANNYGVTLLENNCSPWSFYGVGGLHDLRTVLMATQTSRYSGHWSKTDWEMSWGIYGNTGDWTNGSVQRGYEFNSPLIARAEATHGGQLPKEYSFLTVEPENIIVTAVKKWEDESPTRTDSLTMQVRFYEVDGKNTDAVLKFPSSPAIAAWESKGNEYGVYGDKLPVTSDAGRQKVTFTTGHNQIRSLKVQMPYGASSPRQIDGHASIGVPHAVAVLARVCNVKGQTLWQGEVGQMEVGFARALRPGGMYVVQYLARNGSILESRKICGLGQITRR